LPRNQRRSTARRLQNGVRRPLKLTVELLTFSSFSNSTEGFTVGKVLHPTKGAKNKKQTNKSNFLIAIINLEGECMLYCSYFYCHLLWPKSALLTDSSHLFELQLSSFYLTDRFLKWRPKSGFFVKISLFCIANRC
jgi:hypothetical protein